MTVVEFEILELLNVISVKSLKGTTLLQYMSYFVDIRILSWQCLFRVMEMYQVLDARSAEPRDQRFSSPRP